MTIRSSESLKDQRLLFTTNGICSKASIFYQLICHQDCSFIKNISSVYTNTVQYLVFNHNTSFLIQNHVVFFFWNNDRYTRVSCLLSSSVEFIMAPASYNVHLSSLLIDTMFSAKVQNRSLNHNYWNSIGSSTNNTLDLSEEKRFGDQGHKALGNLKFTMTLAATGLSVLYTSNFVELSTVVDV